MLEETPQTWLDIWALCRRDHGLTWEEFGQLTLAQLEALEERRAIAIRHSRYNAGLVAAALYNVHRPPGSDLEPLSAFDFLPGFQSDPEDVEHERKRKEVKRSMIHAMTRLPLDCTAAQARDVRDRVISGAREMGFDDAEDMFREMYPDDIEG